MSEREQWRFQWPDGTWIRWNPARQSWEKEEGEGQGAAPDPSRRAETPVRTETPARAEPSVTAPTPDPPVPTTPTSATVTRSPSGWKSVGEADEEAPSAMQPIAVEVAEEEPIRPVSAEPDPHETEQPPTRGPRLGVSDVIPPREPDRPGGALWPTIVAGAAVGIAVGLLLSNVVR